MASGATNRFIDIAKCVSVYEQTVLYLQQKLQAFLRPNEQVLICNGDTGQFGMATLLEKAVAGAGGIPLLLGEDRRWYTILKTAFYSRASVIIGPPLLILGLTKLAKHTATPLNIRNVLLAGAPSEDWMIEGIRHGLDAGIWGCYDPVPGLVVGGFSCGKSLGVHLRSDVLDAQVRSEDGRLLLRWKHEPEAVFVSGEQGRLCSALCSCGSKEPRIMDFISMDRIGDPIEELRERLLSWTSVLDYRASRTEMGLELEMIVFPGERLPKLPSCARRLVRQWMPKTDEPFSGVFL
ncbi:MAG: hypothetical protein IJB17_01875 [Oscillospiraceae bacterium]|nr:hypothetical protein [Oscillospiraceae bacterium]